MRNKAIGLALAMLVLAALACALPGASSDGALFKDDFSRDSSGWGEDTSSVEGTRAYKDGQYVFAINEGGWIFWAVPEEKFDKPIHIEVTATNPGEATDPGFGIICNYQDDDNFHMLGIDPDGLYAIGIKENGTYRILSSEDEFWSESQDLAINADSYRMGANCDGENLVLVVDG